MAKSKNEKRRDALARLTASVAGLMAKGRAPTFSQRMEYNALKASLGEPGRLI